MFAPIYCSQAQVPSSDIRAAERDMIADEGYCHVNGQYFAREADATQARRIEAERRVSNYTRFLCAPTPAVSSIVRVVTPRRQITRRVA
jgi:hypothetical protein